MKRSATAAIAALTVATACQTGATATHFNHEELANVVTQRDVVHPLSVQPSTPLVNNGRAWNYAGVPYPTDWPYDPFTVVRPTPNEWPAAPAPNFYYVAPDAPNASDTPSTGEITGTFGRFGYPDRPRKSFPTGGWIGDTFGPGTVIVLSGGTYSADSFFVGRSEYSPRLQGSADSPIFISGDPANPPTFTDVVLRPYDSRYFVIENLHWNGSARGIAIGLARERGHKVHHATLRHNTFENMAWSGSNSAIIAATAGTRDNGHVHDIVVYRNTFKNNGLGTTWSTATDEDMHAVKLHAASGVNVENYRVWVVENDAIPGDQPDADGFLKSLSGNLVQVGDQASRIGGVHHIYVAGNSSRHTRQALAWTKVSNDVVFSTNTCAHTRAAGGGNGQCYGSQYQVAWQWALNNTAEHAAFGWQHTSGETDVGPFIIAGNVFHTLDVGDSAQSWGGQNGGVALWNAHGEYHIVNNTIHGADFGVWASNRVSNATQINVHNNIVTALRGQNAKSAAMWLENQSGQVYVSHNLFHTMKNTTVANQPYSTVAELNDTTFAENNLTGDPNLANPPVNVSLFPGSPALNAGTTTPTGGAPDVYQMFIDRYTGDPHFSDDPARVMNRDLAGNARTTGANRDIGAIESDYPKLPSCP